MAEPTTPFLCGGDRRLQARSACPQAVHDWPLPADYVDAGDTAQRRLRKGWKNVACKHCGVRGWRPGKIQAGDIKVAAPLFASTMKGLS